MKFPTAEVKKVYRIQNMSGDWRKVSAKIGLNRPDAERAVAGKAGKVYWFLPDTDSPFCTIPGHNDAVIDIETALNAVKEWYGDEFGFSIHGITEDPEGNTEGYEQSDVFLSVRGHQHILPSGDEFEGKVFFEFAPGKFIETLFWG